MLAMLPLKPKLLLTIHKNKESFSNRRTSFFTSLLSKVAAGSSWMEGSLSLLTVSFFTTVWPCGLLLGWMCSFVLDMMRQWSVQQSATHCLSYSHILLVLCSDNGVAVELSVHECLDRGCIHDVLLWLGRVNMLPVMAKPWVSHVLSRRRLLVLHLPTSWCLMTPPHAWWSWSTWALKSPRSRSLSTCRTVEMRASSSS